MKSERDKVKRVTESESPDHFKKLNCTLEASRKTPYLRKFMLCTQQALKHKLESKKGRPVQPGSYTKVLKSCRNRR